MKRSFPLFVAAVTLASAGTLAAVWRRPAGSLPVGPGAVPSPRVVPDADARLAEHIEPGAGPGAVAERREVAATDKATANKAEAEAVRQRAMGLGQEFGLSPSDRAFLNELLLEEQAQRADLVAEWRRSAQSEAASAALRIGLDDLATCKRAALRARLGAPVADEVVRRLGRRAPPPAQQVEAGRSPAGTGRAAR